MSVTGPQEFETVGLPQVVGDSTGAPEEIRTKNGQRWLRPCGSVFWMRGGLQGRRVYSATKGYVIRIEGG